MIGETVGSYRIEAKLAEGGMGAVYRAVHALLGKPAAVKVLLPEFSGNREIVTRFFNEAKAASAVRHPGIVEIFDFGYMASGIAYIVMELLEGETLSRRLARGAVDETTALLFVRGIASALAAAHGQGIVHRDLKPDNVYLVPDADLPGGIRVKLLDFGIAKVAEALRGNEGSKTRTGSVIGTPTYMSPEQCRGSGSVDQRSDLYSLGCIVYEMVAGRPPFVAEGVGELLGAHLYMPPTPVGEVAPTVSANLGALVMNLLAKNPEERVQTAAEIGRLLGAGTLPVVGTAVAVPSAVAPVYRTPPPPGSAAFTLPGSSPGLVARASSPGVSRPGAAAGTSSPGAATVLATPTTLGGSAVVVPAPAAAGPRRRTGLVVGLGLAVAAGAAAAVLTMGGGGGGGASNAAGGAGTAPAADAGAATPPPPPPPTTTPTATTPSSTDEPAPPASPADAPTPPATPPDAGAAPTARPTKAGGRRTQPAKDRDDRTRTKPRDVSRDAPTGTTVDRGD